MKEEKIGFYAGDEETYTQFACLAYDIVYYLNGLKKHSFEYNSDILLRDSSPEAISNKIRLNFDTEIKIRNIRYKSYGSIKRWKINNNCI